MVKSFMGITDPFHKPSVNDFEGVLVPLEQAVRLHETAAEYARRQSHERVSDSPSSEKKDKSADTESGVMRTNSAGYSPYTIEGLRAEINEDVAASGHDSAYDRKVSVT
jgi:hypothetical protein